MYFPVIIHLRLKTKNVEVYDKIAKMLYQSFGDKLLDPKYSYKNDKTRKHYTLLIINGHIN